MTSQYSDIHRCFLQVVMSRGSISENSANKVLAELFASETQNTPTEEDLQLVIDAINERIHKFDQRIDVVTSMYDDKTYVVMVNTTQSAIMKLQDTFKPHEIEFFRLLIKELALSVDHSIQTINVLNLMTQSRSKEATFSISKSEKMLYDWIEEGYFYLNDGVVYLGVRAVAEFGEFLRNKFNVDNCHLCKDILLKGVDCDAGTCNGRFHTSCIRKYMAKNTKCPMCKTVWKSARP